MTAVAGLTFTVTRGVEGSTAATHANAAAVTHVLTAGALAALGTDHTGLTNPHSGKYPALSLVTAKGDLLVGTGAGAMIGVPAGANDTVLVADSAQVSGVKWGSGVAGPTGATGPTGPTGAQGPSGPTGSMLVTGATPYANIQDQKASGTPGGTFTTGAWRTRTLNLVTSDSTGMVTLNGSSQITLAAGTYRCRILCPAIHVGRHQARLFNVTDSGLLVLGQGSVSSTGGFFAQTVSEVAGRFALASTKTLEVQHICETTSSTTEGFGEAGSFGTEVFTIAEFWLEGGPPPFFGSTIATFGAPREHSGRIARQNYAAITAVVQHSLNTPPQ